MNLFSHVNWPSLIALAKILAMSAVEIGISGWTYDGWRGTFYPRKLAHKHELEFASHALPSIEINGTFYALQKPETYRHWYEATPENFIFALKAHRYITHVKRLHDIERPLANFFASGPLLLEEKLGPILWQFPPSLSFDPERFEKFFQLLPKDFMEVSQLAQSSDLPVKRIHLTFQKNLKIRHAVEVRHYSFLNPWFIELLREYKIALVFADTAGKWPYMEDITADFIYARLHGDEELYSSGYDDQTLDFWARRIKAWKQGRYPQHKLTMTDAEIEHIDRDVFVYFDNDQKTRAPFDARRLIQKLESRHVM